MRPTHSFPVVALRQTAGSCPVVSRTPAGRMASTSGSRRSAKAARNVWGNLALLGDFFHFPNGKSTMTGPFIDDFPIKTSIYLFTGSSMATLVITRGQFFFWRPRGPRVSFQQIEGNPWEVTWKPSSTHESNWVSIPRWEGIQGMQGMGEMGSRSSWSLGTFFVGDNCSVCTLW